MDIILFVLGVRRMYLRSNDKTDLVYRGRRLLRAPDNSSQMSKDEDEIDGDGNATSACPPLMDTEPKIEMKVRRVCVSLYTSKSLNYCGPH
jgi:hypothetical protein